MIAPYIEGAVIFAALYMLFAITAQPTPKDHHRNCVYKFHRWYDDQGLLCPGCNQRQRPWQG